MTEAEGDGCRLPSSAVVAFWGKVADIGSVEASAK